MTVVQDEFARHCAAIEGIGSYEGVIKYITQVVKDANDTVANGSYTTKASLEMNRAWSHLSKANDAYIGLMFGDSGESDHIIPAATVSLRAATMALMMTSTTVNLDDKIKPNKEDGGIVAFKVVVVNDSVGQYAAYVGPTDWPDRVIARSGGKLKSEAGRALAYELPFLEHQWYEREYRR